MATIRVLHLPHDHDFVRRAAPSGAVAALPMTRGQARGWERSPAFDPGWVVANRAHFDVVHLHFGFETIPAADLQAWAELLQTLRIPLVFTVHDLRNPHQAAPESHDALLQLLTAAADDLVTLTPGAARELQSRFGRTAAVIAHPPLLPPVVGKVRSGLVGISLKPRAQVVEADALVLAVLAGVEAARPRRPGVALRVSAHPSLRAELPRTAAAAAENRLVLEDLARLEEAAFAASLGELEVAVLPYRFGTHSGWLEACRDVGTRVVAPDCGYYAEQWDEVVTYRNNERAGLGAASLTDAVCRALLAEPLPAGGPQQPRVDASREGYAAVYERALGRAA